MSCYLNLSAKESDDGPLERVTHLAVDPLRDCFIFPPLSRTLMPNNSYRNFHANMKVFTPTISGQSLFTEVGSRMLHYNPIDLNYDKALQYCAGLGARLVEIHNEQEWLEVKQPFLLEIICLLIYVSD